MSLVACILAAACSGDAATAVSGPEEPVGTATVSSVEMNSSNVNVAIDGSAALSLDVRTENGEPLDRDGEWTVPFRYAHRLHPVYDQLCKVYTLDLLYR